MTDPPIRRPAFVRLVLLGLLAGSAYGATLRAWMRFVSDEHEFTWSGTLFIIGAFTVVGGMAGLVEAGRRRSWRRRLLGARVVAIIVGLACFGGAGLLMLPTIVPAGLAAGRHDWGRRVRIGLVVVAAAFAVLTVATLSGLGVAHRVAATVTYLGLCAVEANGFGTIYAPSLPVGTITGLGRRGRPAVVALGIVGLLFVVLTSVGI